MEPRALIAAVTAAGIAVGCGSTSAPNPAGPTDAAGSGSSSGAESASSGGGTSGSEGSSPDSGGSSSGSAEGSDGAVVLEAGSPVEASVLDAGKEAGSPAPGDVVVNPD